MHYIISDFWISFKIWFYPLVNTDILWSFSLVKLTLELVIVAAAAIFVWWISVLREAVQFFVSEKVKPQTPLEPNVLPEPDTFT